MLFYSEKKQCLYACQADWDLKSTVMRVPVGAMGHVKGEQYKVTDTPRQIHIEAAKTGMIDLNCQINVMGVEYRLDLQNLRIKHLSQAAKTTSTDSGKARKGQLSWQTFQKFDLVGELAYSWFELIGQSPAWRKLKPYVLPRDITGDSETEPGIAENGWTCPDCGAVNDANSGECDCGTTYDGEIETMPGEPGPGEQESGETVEGELLPPVNVELEHGLAVVEPDAYAQRVGQLHQAAQQHATASVLCAAIAGAVMHAKKKSVKHGEFGDWIEGMADSIGISRPTCIRYMALADEMAARMKELPKTKRELFLAGNVDDGANKRPILQLLAGLNPAELDSDQALLVADAVREVTSDQTLRQLYFDWGIMKSNDPVRKGGDMELQAWLREHHPELAGTKLAGLPASIRAEFAAFREARKPSDAEELAGKREFARRWWERQRLYLVEIGGVGSEVPTWGLLPDQDLLQTMVLLERTAQAMKRVLNERGAR